MSELIDTATKNSARRTQGIVEVVLTLIVISTTFAISPLPSTQTYEFSNKESATLFLATSLSEDYDFDTADEIAAAKRSGSASQSQTLNPNIDSNIAAGRDGALALIVTAPWSLGGTQAVRITMALALGVLTLMTMRIASTYFGADMKRSAITALIYTSSPVIFFGHQINSGVFAAIAMLAAITALVREQPSILRAVISIAALTLLSPQYFAVATVLAIWLITTQSTRRTQIVYTVGFATLWALQYYFMWKTAPPTPSATMLFTGMNVFVAFIAHGPVFIFAPAAFAWYYASQHKNRVALNALAITSWITAAVTAELETAIPAVAIAAVIFAAVAQRHKLVGYVIIAAAVISTIFRHIATQNALAAKSNIETIFAADPSIVHRLHTLWISLMPDISASVNTIVPVAAFVIGVETVAFLARKELRAQQISDDKFGNRSQSLVTLDDDLGSDLEDIIEP